MSRLPNTDRRGYTWSHETKVAVWNKGRIIPDYRPDLWRWDKCGLVMNWFEHGNRNSEHGWEIDHINPVANGGTDDFYNLQPLNWVNNADKSDKLNWECPLRR